MEGDILYSVDCTVVVQAKAATVRTVQLKYVLMWLRRAEHVPGTARPAQRKSKEVSNNKTLPTRLWLLY